MRPTPGTSIGSMQHLAAELLAPASGRVDVVDRDVAAPRRRHAGGAPGGVPMMPPTAVSPTLTHVVAAHARCPSSRPSSRTACRRTRRRPPGRCVISSRPAERAVGLVDVHRRAPGGGGCARCIAPAARRRQACGTIAPHSRPMSLVFPHTFVPWFRSVAPYIHAYRGKTFVVAMAGEVIAAGKLNAFVQDLAILHAMGIKLVLVHGFRPQVNEQLRGQGPRRRASATACASPTRWRSTARRRPPASCASRSRPRSRRACRTRRWPTRRCAWSRATSSPRGRSASSTASTSCTAALVRKVDAGGDPARDRHRRAGAAVARSASRPPARPST